MEVTPPFICLIGIFILGWVWFKFVLWGDINQKLPRRASELVFGTTIFLTIIAALWPIVPFVLLLTGEVSSMHGMPWWSHLAFVGILVLSTPVGALGQPVEWPDRLRNLKVPCCGCTGLAAEFYMYTMDVIYRADTYLDACAVCIAFSAGYPLAWLMATLYGVGVFFQPMLTYLVKRCTRPPEHKEAKVPLDNFILCCIYIFFCSPFALTTEERSWAEIVRALTESVPQPCLQLHYALFMSSKKGKAQVTLFLSIALSVMLSSRAIFAVFELLGRKCTEVCGPILCEPTLPPDSEPLKP